LSKLGPELDGHAEGCDDRVVGIVISNEDFDELEVAYIWGVPVLASDEIERGRLELLCEAHGTLIPPHDTVQDILDHCQYRLETPRRSEDAA
jgi:hypothetical protein